MNEPDAPAPEEDTPRTRNRDRYGEIRDTANQQAQAAVDDGEARGLVEGTSDGELSQDEEPNETTFLVAAYGKLTSLMMSRTCCSGFPFCLPLPNTILSKAKKQTKKEILAIVEGKCSKEYLEKRNSSLKQDPDMKGCCC